MVNAMLLRIHQSGNLASLNADAAAQVKEGIRVYRETVREHIPDSVPFYPLGMPDVTSSTKPIALGIKSPRRSFVAVWRIDGDGQVQIPGIKASAQLLYPSNLGITVTHDGKGCTVTFPRPRMGCILAL